MKTPFYLIDENRMLDAMQKIQSVRNDSGAKSVLALKCFSTWCAFDFMKDYLVGTTSSSLYEAKLGHEKFGGETHGYSVAYTDDEIDEVIDVCDKIIFNSLSQLNRYHAKAKAAGVSIGLRLNPQVGFSEYLLSDTVSKYSRLGVTVDKLPKDISESLHGAMLHMNCENENFESFSAQLDEVEVKFSSLLFELEWLSLGGGVAFTTEGYPLKAFSARLKALAQKFSLQIYLEPGEASVTESTSMVVSVIDIVDNEVPTLIVDAGVETHLLDALVYDYTPELINARALDDKNVIAADTINLPNLYRVAGRTCLAGDIFGVYQFEKPIQVGDTLTFSDTGGYSMVKKNFFNGIKMPSIYLKKLNGETERVKTFTYEDFRDFLS